MQRTPETGSTFINRGITLCLMALLGTATFTGTVAANDYLSVASSSTAFETESAEDRNIANIPGRLTITTARSITAAEGQALKVSVARIGGASGELTARLNMVTESASPSDLSINNPTLTWADNELGSKDFLVSITADALSEGTEEAFLQLSSAQGTSVIDPNSRSVYLVITDNTAPQDTDDSGLTLTFQSPSTITANIGDTLDNLTLSVDTSGAQLTAGQEVFVQWRVEPSDAASLTQSSLTSPDEAGRVQNGVSILKNGTITVIASALIMDSEPRTKAQTPLSRAVSLSANEAAFTIRSGIVATQTFNTNQQQASTAIANACAAVEAASDGEGGIALTTGQESLLATCTAIENAEDAAPLLDRVAAEEAFAIGDALISGAELQVSNVSTRLNAIRSGVGSRLDVSGMQLNIDGQTINGNIISAAKDSIYAYSGGGASADSFIDSRLGLFANGSLSIGKVEGKGQQQDASLDSLGLTFGVDYRLNNNMVAGTSLGLTDSKTDFSGDNGDTESTGVNVSLFGTWYEQDQGYADVVLDIANNSFDINRRINLPGQATEFASGSTDASVLSLTMGAGRHFTHGATQFGPSVRLSISKASVDGYRERSSQAQSQTGTLLDVKSHSLNSITMAFGGEISHTINTRKAVLIPMARLELEIEGKDNKGGIDATFINSVGANTLSLEGTKRDTSYMNISVGATAVLPKSRSAYLIYETQALNSFITQNWLKAGLRLHF